jgi:hypothetical protein
MPRDEKKCDDWRNGTNHIQENKPRGYWTIKQLRSYSLSNSLISQDAFELLANYTKTNTKLIPYFDQEYLFQPK